MPNAVVYSISKVGIMPYEQIKQIAYDFAPELEYSETTARADPRYSIIVDAITGKYSNKQMDLHSVMLSNMNPNGNIIEQVRILPKPNRK